MQEQYCGWCGATTMGSYNGEQETWICGICRGSDHIPGQSDQYRAF
jgi:hypothetical protein